MGRVDHRTAESPLVEIPARGQSGRKGLIRGRSVRTIGLLVMLTVLACICVLSLALGARSVPTATAIDSILRFDPDVTDQVVVRDLRVPRTLIGLTVGAALGLAGAMMQGITRNPLADPGILGVSAGATFAVALAVLVLQLGNVFGLLWFAFAGAAIGAVLTYGIASLGRGGPTPIKLAITGTAVTALLFALTTLIALRDLDTLSALRFWGVGSLTGPNADALARAFPFVLGGALLALGSGRVLNALSLGEDVARSLGQRIGVARAVAALAIIMLAGGATALAGPVVFLGLVIPHVARALTGSDYRWILPYSMLLGPILILGADILGRLIARPAEVQVGILMALIGGPFFVGLVRRRELAEL